MGKKVKIGKQRRDKAYWSAKEIGYRSRASFKLVQLNRKFEFLQKARVCIDLCAAPGSWMQVAKEHMPMSSLIIGVDLVPIKPIPGCIAQVNDITTTKCRSDIKKELQGWKADVVLHDGAPNVGKNWIHDAYSQSLLTLSAFKLASEFLMKGGTFVTKVFRSKDYQSLMWVFNQFFKRVEATKPQASRNESAEIFVVCRGYKAPDKIDPRFLDPKAVFSELEMTDEALENADREIINPEKKKKAPAEGYEDGATVLYKKIAASEFIFGERTIHILNNYSEIHLDQPRIYQHSKTTKEVRECCKDLKVLGMKDLRVLKKWREALKFEFEQEDKKAEEKRKKDAGEEEVVEEVEETDEDEKDLNELEETIETAKKEEKQKEKRLKKKSLKEKRKTAERIDLKMILPGDEGPQREEEGLFRIKDLKTAQDVEDVEEQEPDMVAESSDDEDGVKKPKTKKVSKEKGKLDKSGLYYKESDSSDNDDSEYETEDELDGIGLDEKTIKKIKKVTGADLDKFNSGPSNPLLRDLDNDSKDMKKQKKAAMWFSRDIFNGILEDEELMEDDIEAGVEAVQEKGGKIIGKDSDDEDDDKTEIASVKKSKKRKASKKENSSDEESDESEDEESDSDEEETYKGTLTKKSNQEKDGFDVVPASKGAAPPPGKKLKRTVLTPEELALGQEMVMSKKKKRDLVDAGWNRFMFGEKDSELPDWFVAEERMHMRPRLQLDPKTIAEYRERQKELNVKTVKKVVEAKARKKRKMVKKLDKAKKRAAVLMENPDLGAREKANEIKRMYKKAQATQKKEVTYVVAKKHAASKRAKRPNGVKGIYKQVDPRMKKDTSLKRERANVKKMQKRRLKGKKTRPNGGKEE